jgi:hypothetical protein
MRHLGPRVFFKRDSESAVGRGADVRGAHFRPEISKIIWAACRAAPLWTTEVWVTEGYRDVRDSRDLHEELRALDFTFRYEDGTRPTDDQYRICARAMEKILGPDYDSIAHGNGLGMHIHSELDPS